MSKKRYDDHHEVISKNGKTERAKHVNAKPYKRSKYKPNYEEDV